MSEIRSRMLSGLLVRLYFYKMEETLKQVQLDQIHRELGAKIVPFAGYEMPLKYSSVVEEHLCVRSGVGIFDVSHMGEFIIEGPEALGLIQSVTSNDAAKLSIGQAQYSCLPNDSGGIVDDLLVYRLDEKEYLLVVNASNIEKDWNWIVRHNTQGAVMKNVSDDFSLFAVQGPKAVLLIDELTDIDATSIPYYHFTTGRVAESAHVIISATGYTGSGGFELYVKNEDAEALWQAILTAGQSYDILPIGLGARDTLRLEKGFCLYGNDIDDTTSPIEAGLSWITKFTKVFTHADQLQAQKSKGVARKLVGFKMLDRGIPRHDYTIVDEAGQAIGHVTSGGHSPSLEIGIGLGYVAKAYAKVGSEVFIQIRKKQLKAQVVKLPFV